MMMSGGGRSSSAVDTLNAAASVIAAGDNRSSPQSTPVQKRRWGGFWNLSGCVVTRKQRNRIVDAVLVPDPIAPRTDAHPAETHIQAPQAIVFPFIAPPSSPASFHHSEPSSVTLLSPANELSLASNSKSMYSSDGPSSMFAVGPYAHETQLVSPPVPSTYTTEPSTAPFTPPPESVYHLTTPSSPEVPFARLLDPIHQNVENGIYSSSTLSSLPDDECRHFINIRSGQGSGTMTPEATESLDRVRFMQEHRKSYGSSSRSNIIQHMRFSDDEHLNHRLSFEITAEEVTRCVEKKPIGGGLNKTLLSSSFETLQNALREREDTERHLNRRPFSPMSAKEFNFDSVNRGNSSSSPPIVCSNWWANEKVLDIEGNT